MAYPWRDMGPFSLQTLNPLSIMSHWTTLKTQIKDPEALRAACAEMGLTLIQNGVARGYYTNELKADFVVKLKGPYDVAVQRQPDGTYGLTTDWWSGHVEKEVGKNYGRLMQLYGAHKTMRDQRRLGHMVSRQQTKDGKIRLTISC